jgi:aspartate ammonia-lyase
LNPYIGYTKATEIAQEALRSGRAVRALVLERKLMNAEQLAEVLRPEALTRRGAPRSISSQVKRLAA